MTPTPKMLPLKIPLVELSVVHIDFAISLQFAGDATTVLRVELPFKLMSGDNEIAIDPSVHATIPAVLDLFQVQLMSATAEQDGTLLLKFANGVDMVVPPDRNERYESWSLSGAGGYLVVCKPSGGLSTWE
jgi:hypothetical protein